MKAEKNSYKASLALGGNFASEKFIQMKNVFQKEF